MSFGSNVMPRRFGAGRPPPHRPKQDTERWLDNFERRARRRPYVRAEAELRLPCPSPGCPHALYLDTTSRVWRCQMHGPMTCDDGSAPAAAT